MSLNEGFSETFIFCIKRDTFKVVINFTKGMYTVYRSSGRILLREEEVSQKELRELKKKIVAYLDNDNPIARNFFKGSGVFI